MNCKNKYKGKLFSVFGDSISTFEGYCPPHYPVYYQYDKRYESGVLSVEDTWWHKVITYFGGELLANNSWSGGWVSKWPGIEDLYPAGCSEGRIEELSKKGIAPDVIIIYMGTNDWGYGALKDNLEGLEFFPNAYDEMIKGLKKRYPNAELWCCSLNMAVSASPMYRFVPILNGFHLEDYNRIISDVCGKYGCRFINIFKYNTPYTAHDGAHPDKEGMEMLASFVIKEIECCE